MGLFETCWKASHTASTAFRFCAQSSGDFPLPHMKPQGQNTERGLPMLHQFKRRKNRHCASWQKCHKGSFCSSSKAHVHLQNLPLYSHVRKWRAFTETGQTCGYSAGMSCTEEFCTGTSSQLCWFPSKRSNYAPPREKGTLRRPRL